MKMAVTATDNQLESAFDLRFGRSSWFCVFDTETDGVVFIENDNKNANGGAGTKAAEKIAELGVKKVISGDFGPKAKALLERLEIQMIILDEEEKTVQEVVNKILKEV